MPSLFRIAALLLVSVLAIAAGAQVRNPPASARMIVVLPFENTSKAPGLEWISESFPEILGQRLASPELYVVSREDRTFAFDRAGVPANVHLSRATLFRIAEQMDADFVVLGSYNFNGQTFTAEAELLDMKALRLSPAMIESGPLLRLAELQTALAWDLLRQLRSQPLPPREQFLAAAPAVRLDALESYVRGLLATSRPEKIKRFREAIRLTPDYNMAMLQLARTYYAGHDYEQAANWFARVPRNSPQGREASFYLGLSEYYTGEFEKAESAFSFLVSRLPLTEVYNNLGVVAGRRGKRSAIEYFQKATKADPSDPDYHFNFGVELYKFGDTAGAARQMREVLSLRPTDTEARSFLETIPGSAAASLRNADSHSPAAKAPLERIKRNYDETSFQQLALEIQNATELRLSKTDPRTHAAYHVDHGRELLAQGFLSEAEKDFREAVLLDPLNVAAHVGLARTLEETNESSARWEAESALRLQPSVDALLVLARLDLKSNQPQAAQNDVDRALALEPNNSAALALKRTIAEKAPK
ncbi:MAG: tetratricopeptide repeat protein [Terriglobales bacterium]